MITKKQKWTMLFGSAALALTFGALSGANLFANNAVAQAEEEAWNNYEVVSDDSGAFKGVNIKDNTEGALSVVIPTGAATYAANTETGFLGAFAVTTIDLNDFNVDNYTGIAIQFDRTHASQNYGPRFFLETTDGTWYRFNSGSERNDTVVKADGAVTSWKNERSRYTSTAGYVGTLYVEFSKIIKAADASAIPEGTVFSKFHYAMDTRANGFYGDNRAHAFGSIAAVKVGESVTADRVFDATSLTWTADATNTTSDVNIADMTKGTKVYAKHTIAGTYEVDNTADMIATVNAVPVYSRTAIKSNELKCVDASGAEIAEATTFVSSWDATQKAFTYSVTAPTVGGYVYKSADPALEGTANGKTTVTLTYELMDSPDVTLKFVDGEGNSIAADQVIASAYDFDQNVFTYNIEAPAVFGYEYVSADKALSGTLEADMAITLTYSAKAVDLEKYEAIYDDNGEFVGVNVKNTMSGSIIINVTGINASAGYALTTVDVEDFMPEQSTGILVQVKRISGVGNAQVRMYLEDSNGNLYRLFTANGDRANAGDSVIIAPDGSVGNVVNEAQNNRHQFALTTEGTIYIPWDMISSVEGNEAIPAGTVFTKFHFGRETRYDTTCNKPVALGTIAAVKVTDSGIEVEELANTATMSYATDASNTESDVNLADMTKGTKVYFTTWLTGTHKLGTAEGIFESLVTLVEFTRMPPTITLVYVDENGETIKANTVADAEYAIGGSTFDITAPAIVGYDFVSADKELKGVANEDFSITLTYKKAQYTITLEFVDEKGVEISETKEVKGTFGEYVELTAEEIAGYTYKEATSGLNFTITGNKTIRLTYSKNAAEGGCSSSVFGLIGTVTLLAAAGFVAFKKKED